MWRIMNGSLNRAGGGGWGVVEERGGGRQIPLCAVTSRGQRCLRAFPLRRPPLPRWKGSAVPPPSRAGQHWSAALSPQDSPLLQHPPTLLHPFVFFFPPLFLLLSVRLSARGTASNAETLPYGAPPGLERPPAPASHSPPSTQSRQRCAGVDPRSPPPPPPPTPNRTPSPLFFFPSSSSSPPDPQRRGGGSPRHDPNE